MKSVDVLLPVRYPAPWLNETLQGLTEQDSSDWNLIVVLHGDDVGLSETVRASGIPARVLRADAQLSLAEVLNAGLRICTAPYVARLDADDIPLPNRLRQQQSRLEENPDSALAVSPAFVIDDLGTVQGIRTVPSTPDDVIHSLAWKNCIIHPATMFRRESVIGIGGYSSTALHVEDYELWLRLLTSYNVCIAPDAAIKYRLHFGQVTSKNVIENQARASIKKARLNFARARGIPTPLARLQQAIWSSRQVARQVVRNLK